MSEWRTTTGIVPLPCEHSPKHARGVCAPCYQKWRFDLMPKATCHPQRREHAGGLCRECYRGGERAKRASCHPERLVSGRGLCRECYTNLSDVKATAIRARRLRKYSLSETEYTRLLETQGWVCAICGGEPNAVDHDHKTNAVRGLLCRNCNSGIGFFADDVSRLRSAIQYLERTKTR